MSLSLLMRAMLASGDYSVSLMIPHTLNIGVDRSHVDATRGASLAQSRKRVERGVALSKFCLLLVALPESATLDCLAQ